MSSSVEEMIQEHLDCDCIVVHPNGQLQSIKQCWCKLYHVFGEKIQFEDMTETHLKEDFICVYFKDGRKYNQPSNINMDRRLLKNIFGPAVIFRKGHDVTPEEAKNILMFR